MSALESEGSTSVPSAPYRGIEEFRYVDEPIFFGRKDELRVLLRLVTMYRGVLLFGDSGAGKSSLINAGLLPALVRDQFSPERIRVQPKLGGEFIVERIATTDNADGPFLPSLFADCAAGRRITISAEEFARRVESAPAGEVCTLLIFDQFEELVTLTEQVLRDGNDRAEVEKARNAITNTLMSLLRNDSASTKMLFVFREDYYAKLSRFFAGFPNLADHFFRLELLRTDNLNAVIRGPFRDTNLVFEPKLPGAVMSKLEAEFRERSATDFVSLSEVQIACLRLWMAREPEALLESEHVNGLLEGYFSEATQSIRSGLRTAALAILGRLVTSQGTRNVVSLDTLYAQLTEDKIDRPTAEAALKALEETARVIRKEPRSDVAIYELVSEFLVPWIRRQKIDARVGEREKKWMRAFAISCGVAVVVALVAFVMVSQRSKTESALRLRDAEAARDSLQSQLEIEHYSRVYGVEKAAEQLTLERQRGAAAVETLAREITILIVDDEARIRQLTSELENLETLDDIPEAEAAKVERKKKIAGLRVERLRLQRALDEARAAVTPRSLLNNP